MFSLIANFDPINQRGRAPVATLVTQQPRLHCTVMSCYIELFCVLATHVDILPRGLHCHLITASLLFHCSTVLYRCRPGCRTMKTSSAGAANFTPSSSKFRRDDQPTLEQNPPPIQQTRLFLSIAIHLAAARPRLEKNFQNPRPDKAKQLNFNLDCILTSCFNNIEQWIQSPPLPG